MPPLSLANFKIQKYYENKPTFNGVYSRNNLSKIKDGAYIVNLDESESIGTHWIAFMLMIIMQFILIGLELKKFEKKLKKSQEKIYIKANIYSIQVYDSLMC